jgi:hypothetical protein
MVNRSVTLADWDEEALALELLKQWYRAPASCGF